MPFLTYGLLFLYTISLALSPTIEAAARPLTTKEKMLARLDRLGTRDLLHTRIKQKSDKGVGLGDFSIIKGQLKKAQKKYQQRRSGVTKDQLQKYEQIASTFAQKLHRQTSHTQQRFALLADGIATYAAPMHAVNDAFAAAAIAGLDEILLAIIQEGMEVIQLALTITDSIHDGNSQVLIIEDKVVVPLLGNRFKDWIRAEAAKASAARSQSEESSFQRLFEALTLKKS